MRGTTGTEPGHLVHEYVHRLGWPIARCNVVLEGTIDAAYFKVAAELHAQQPEGKTLLDSEFAMFAVGEREYGGTTHLVDRFRTIRDLMLVDPPAPESLLFVILLDDDAAGRGAFGLLVNSIGFREHREVLKVCRSFPRTTRNTAELRKLIEVANQPYAELGMCEIEDLLPADLLDSFAADNPGSLKFPPRRVKRGHHYEWNNHAKSQLLQYVRDHAICSDVGGLIELIKSIRYLLGLDPDGTPMRCAGVSPG